MKHIYLNLKRFDVPAELGGVNRLGPPESWGSGIVAATQEALRPYAGRADFTQFFPEAHLPGALSALSRNSPVTVGCQGVYRADVVPGGNFGAFTANRPAAAMRALGVQSALIGHCEERADLAGVLAEAGVTDAAAVNRILHREMACALAQGLTVLYCIGEKAEEQADWQQVLGQQLSVGLEGLDRRKIVIAYEPVWSIGPGKTPADQAYITKIARFVKQATGGMDVVYGGGLKQANAEMLAAIPEISGGLIALTRFTGEIGFYPDEYLDIIRLYLGNPSD